MKLRKLIDTFLDKYLPNEVVKVSKYPESYTKRQLDLMPVDIYRAKIMNEPGFRAKVDLTLSQNKTKYYTDDNHELADMVADPAEVAKLRRFGA